MAARTMFQYVLLLLAGVVALKFLVVFLEPRMTFFPLRGISLTPEDMGIRFQEIALTTRDGEKVYAWFLEQSRAETEVIFFHGNGGNLSLWLDFLVTLYEHPFTVLALDYRGYGKSTGSPSEEGLYQDTEALLEYFWKTLHRPGRKVVYWGRSLGGGMAAYACTIREPDGLILEAAFPSKKSLLSHYPVLSLLGLFSRYQFPTAEFLRSFSKPVLVIHGDRDRIVPLQEGQKLLAELRTKKDFYTVRGADHNNLHQVDPEGYRARVQEFVKAMNHG